MSPPPWGEGRWRRLLHPSHQHTAWSATVLMMLAIALSRVMGYLREAYIAWAFGAGPVTDAYVAAFTLPDWLNYLLAGGAASITFISVYTRYSSAGRKEEAERAFSVVITVAVSALLVLLTLGEIFAPQIERVVFPGFSPEQLELCVFLTRILLPAQAFFYVGSVLSAVLLSRRMFLLPAFAPLLYNGGIILGGVLLSSRLGITALALGAVAGALAGPFLINAIGAARAGLRYRPSFEISSPAFREWLRLSIPLMLGVSIVAADEWILRFFASGEAGDITRLNYAKRLFMVPLAVLAQAAGQASMPFFAHLWGEGRFDDFAAKVNEAVSRLGAVCLLASSWMMALAVPLVDIVYRRGRFQFADSLATGEFFFWFALALALWATQALYARAFYAAGNTFVPMVAATVVTAVSLPIYAGLFHSRGTVGLVMASDIALVMHTVVVAWLLHRRRMVPVSGLLGKELLKTAATAVFAGLLARAVAQMWVAEDSYLADLMSVGMGSLTWGAAVAVGLWATGSDLPGLLRRRLTGEREPAKDSASLTEMEP